MLSTGSMAKLIRKYFLYLKYFVQHLKRKKSLRAGVDSGSIKIVQTRESERTWKSELWKLLSPKLKQQLRK